MTSDNDFDDDDFDSDEPPLSAEELSNLGASLRAALAPDELAPSLHERILARALEDPLAPASDAEREQANALRDALEDPDSESEAAALARALRHAYGKHAGDADAVHRRAFERAVPKRSNVVWAVFGAAGGALALAAAVALVLTPLSKSAPAPARAELARSRSLAPLLNAEASRMSPSERIDRIASAREKELRRNRYTTWGVR